MRVWSSSITSRSGIDDIPPALSCLIGEFDEVGTTVKEFADDKATVVVGTVIDPDMTDELRVTVVATGLGEGGAQIMDTPIRMVANSDIDVPVLEDQVAAIEKPVLRESALSAKNYVDAATDKKKDYLDIPAFLRRQAD